MGNGRIRFCETCGCEVEIIPVAYLGKKDGYYVYEAICPNGHEFSISQSGFTEVFLKEPPEMFGL